MNLAFARAQAQPLEAGPERAGGLGVPGFIRPPSKIGR
jgi:hypothetical protein